MFQKENGGIFLLYLILIVAKEGETEVLPVYFGRDDPHY